MIGACVQNFNGRRGRLLAVEADQLRIGWLSQDSIRLSEETLPADSYQALALEVLTPEGWVSLLKQERQSLVSEIFAICESGPDQNPFKNKATLGPGPGGRIVKRRNRWECSGSNYSYMCRGIAQETKGQVININIDPAYKAEYNRKYKRMTRERRSQRGPRA